MAKAHGDRTESHRNSFAGPGMSKFSGYISREVHADLILEANRLGSTVTGIVSYAVESVVKDLKRMKEAPRGLALDKRRDRNGKD